MFGANAPKGTFRPYQLSEPQPRGAVTRRAVAQRRSRASGLTRLYHVVRRSSASSIPGRSLRGTRGRAAESTCPGVTMF